MPSYSGPQDDDNDEALRRASPRRVSFGGVSFNNGGGGAGEAVAPEPLRPFPGASSSFTTYPDSKLSFGADFRGRGFSILEDDDDGAFNDQGGDASFDNGGFIDDSGRLFGSDGSLGEHIMHRMASEARGEWSPIPLPAITEDATVQDVQAWFTQSGFCTASIDDAIANHELSGSVLLRLSAEEIGELLTIHSPQLIWSEIHGTREFAEKVFNDFDPEGSGTITHETLQQLLEDLFAPIKPETIRLSSGIDVTVDPAQEDKDDAFEDIVAAATSAGSPEKVLRESFVDWISMRPEVGAAMVRSSSFSTVPRPLAAREREQTATSTPSNATLSLGTEASPRVTARAAEGGEGETGSRGSIAVGGAELEHVDIAAVARSVAHLPFEQRASILFDKADVNGNNKIRLSQFVTLLKDGFGVSADTISQREIKHLFKDLDVGRSGTIEAHDYRSFMADPAAEVVIESLRTRKQSIGSDDYIKNLVSRVLPRSPSMQFGGDSATRSSVRNETDLRRATSKATIQKIAVKEPWSLGNDEDMEEFRRASFFHHDDSMATAARRSAASGAGGERTGGRSRGGRQSSVSGSSSMGSFELDLDSDSKDRLAAIRAQAHETNAGLTAELEVMAEKLTAATMREEDLVARVAFLEQQNATLRSTCAAWQGEATRVRQHAAVMESDQEQLARLLGEACSRGVAALETAASGQQLGTQSPMFRTLALNRHLSGQNLAAMPFSQ